MRRLYLDLAKNACNTTFMKLSSVRELAGLKTVLKDQESLGPDPAYWVFGDISKEEWANLTIIAPGNYNGEYPKTFGHYHPENASTETYYLISGEGILQMQKKHLENGERVPEIVDEVYLIKAKPGDKIVITPEFGHSWSNTGTKPLISFDDWREGHSPSDYEPISQQHGMAYYLIQENGQTKAIPNPNYKDLPEPKWITAEEFARRNQTNGSDDVF